MIVIESVSKALGRLAQSNDFIVFSNWLRNERDLHVATLVNSTNIVLIHQSQGAAQALGDILQATKLAQPALA